MSLYCFLHFFVDMNLLLSQNKSFQNFNNNKNKKNLEYGRINN